MHSSETSSYQLVQQAVEQKDAARPPQWCVDLLRVAASSFELFLGRQRDESRDAFRQRFKNETDVREMAKMELLVVLLDSSHYHQAEKMVDILASLYFSEHPWQADILHLSLQKGAVTLPAPVEATEHRVKAKVRKTLAHPRAFPNVILLQDAKTAAFVHQLISTKLFKKGDILQHTKMPREYFRFTSKMELRSAELLPVVLLISRILDDIPQGFLISGRPLTEEFKRVRLAVWYFTDLLRQVDGALNVDQLAKSIYPHIEWESFLNPLFYQREIDLISRVEEEMHS